MRRQIQRFLAHPLGEALLVGDTTLVRFFFSLVSFGFASYSFADPARFEDLHPFVVRYIAEPRTMATMFCLYGTCLMYGVWTRKHNGVLLVLEGYLGVYLWAGVGLADALYQSAPGPTFFAALISLLLLIRYPMHAQQGVAHD